MAKKKKQGLLKKAVNIFTAAKKRAWYNSYWASKKFMQSIDDVCAGITISYKVYDSKITFFNDYGLYYELTIDQMIKHNLNTCVKLKAFIMSNISLFK